MATTDLLRLLAQYRRGAYTNDPVDANYGNHWRTVRPPEEPIVAVHPGTARQPGLLKPKQMINVVQTPSAYYVDTPLAPRVGPIGRLAGGILDSSGMSEPFHIPATDALVTTPRANRVVINAPAQPIITARTDGYVGPPSELSGREQLRNLGRMLRR